MLVSTVTQKKNLGDGIHEHKHSWTTTKGV